MLKILALTILSQAVEPAASRAYVDSQVAASAHNPVTLGAFGSSPNANGLSLSTQVLTLQPASASQPGAVSTGAQAFGGAKQFSQIGIGTAPTFPFHIIGSGTPTGGAMSRIAWTAPTADAAGISIDMGTAVSGNLSPFTFAGATTGNFQADISNFSAGGSANSKMRVSVLGATGGDPYYEMCVPGATCWSIGIDNSDSDALKILPGDPSAVTGSIRISTAGAVTIPASLGVGGHTITTGLPRGTATLDFASQSLGACEDLTVTVTGATTSSEVMIGVPNAAMVTGSQFQGWVSATNTVSIRHCCVGSVTCDPASASFSARAIIP